MSAIAGIYHLDGRPVETVQIERMVEVLAHRGADGTGVWNDTRVSLGHRMLWTTPESLHEEMPLVSKTRDLVLTADARIDNREELTVALGMTGPLYRNVTDSELILAAYDRWGEDCPQKLLGDFAFVIWDAQNESLFCARDHFGVKPLYYYYQPGRIFVFATEVKALLCVPEVPRRLNETMVADYLYLDQEILHDGAITFYQQILRLPSSHRMTVRVEKLQLRQYWFLDPTREIHFRSDHDYANAYRAIFTEAVRCRLRSAFPVGTTLSGGFDSSSVACVGRNLLMAEERSPLHTFSAICDDVPECDERRFINAVLAQDGLNASYVHADRISPLTELDLVFWHEDEAFAAPNLFMNWDIYRIAHQMGVRVLLDGYDGDTTISHGLVYLTELARREQWHDFAIEAEGLSQHSNFVPLHLLHAYGAPYLTELAHRKRWLALARQTNQLSRHFKLSPWELLLRYGIKPVMPEPIRRTWRALRGRNRPRTSLHGLIKPDFARRVGLPLRVQARQEKRPQTVREDHHRLITNCMQEAVLAVTNKATAAFSVESRHPFFDRRLIEFCLAVPPEQKLNRGWNRIIARRALANILPEEIRWRGGKTDMSPIITRGLLLFERECLEDVILKDPAVIEEYVDIDALRDIYRRYLSHGTADDAYTIWIVVTLALWLRKTGLRP